MSFYTSSVCKTGQKILEKQPPPWVLGASNAGFGQNPAVPGVHKGNLWGRRENYAPDLQTQTYSVWILVEFWARVGEFSFLPTTIHPSLITVIRG